MVEHAFLAEERLPPRLVRDTRSYLDSARRYIAHVLSQIRRNEVHGRASARSGGNPLFSRDSLDRIWPKD
jgi:hypothetical protein